MPLIPQPQDELSAGSPPVLLAEPVEISLKPENMAEQLPTEEDVTLPDMTNGNPATAEDDGDVYPRNQENTGNGEAVDKTQQLNNKPSSDTADKESDITVEETNDPNMTTRKSERSRRPPERFHDYQMGKPLISFAKSLLEGFNKAVDTISHYDGSPVVHKSEHEGTHAELRGEGVTHMKYRATKTLCVV